MKYLFISGLYPKQEEGFFRNNSKSHSLQNAPNVFQWSVVDGLIKNGVDFNVLSAPFVSSYPKGFSRLFIPSFPVIYGKSKIGETVRYCDLVGLKEISIKNNILKGIKVWIKANSIKKTDSFSIITYTPLSIFLSAIRIIKKEYPNIIVCSIITDLIEDAFNFKINQSFLKRLQVNLERKREQKNINIIDRYVLLTEAMLERIPSAKGKYIVVEGISVESNVVLPGYLKDKSFRTILYTGSLHEFSGIKSLVDAFLMTKDKKFRLIICGIGPCEGYIRKAANMDSRIIFLGNIKREEALMEQQKANVLVNPRTPSEEITRYSFPSKTMEYLASGTPMIGYQLEGIPNEYYQFYFSPLDLGVESLSHTINEVLSLSDAELSELGRKAKAFIENKKNSKQQVKKILDLIEK